MKFIVSPEFSRKLADQSSDAALIARVSRVVANVERAANRTELIGLLQLDVGPLSGEMYVAREGDVRVFIAFGVGADGEYAILLDLALARPRPSSRTQPPAYRNPRVNALLNPKRNPRINPSINSALNPRVNPSLNPLVNSTLNPRINASLNPRINSSINPRINSSINPRINSVLNPRINGTINPLRNPAFAGPYVYDLQLKQEGFLVRANDSVDIVFTSTGSMNGIAVRNASGGFTLFDNKNDWIGYLVRANDDVLLRFSKEGEWIGVIV